MSPYPTPRIGRDKETMEQDREVERGVPVESG